MDPFLKSSLKTQIEVYLQKFPNASTEDIKTWVKTGVQVPMLQGVKRKTLNKFILYQKKKFQSTGSCAKHRGGNGRPSTSNQTVARVKNLAINKKNRSLSPIFVSDLCAMYDPKPKTVNAQMYSDMIREQVGPAVLEVYPDGSGIFQDDGATIHRARISLDAVKETFNHRLSVGDQASKQADIWPIENVWAIVKAKIDKTETTSLAQLKRKIVSVWREIDADKDLCRRMMASIPARLAAVVRKQGSQITKEDY